MCRHTRYTQRVQSNVRMRTDATSNNAGECNIWFGRIISDAGKYSRMRTKGVPSERSRTVLVVVSQFMRVLGVKLFFETTLWLEIASLPIWRVGHVNQNPVSFLYSSSSVWIKQKGALSRKYLNGKCWFISIGNVVFTFHVFFSYC